MRGIDEAYMILGIDLGSTNFKAALFDAGWRGKGILENISGFRIPV